MWIAARAGRFYQAQQSINNRARRLFTYDATRPVHFTAPINAFSVSSGGQQQRSTPLFGSGASMSISTGQPVIGAPLTRSVLTLFVDDDRREKDFCLCRLRAGRGEFERARFIDAIRCFCWRRSRSASAQRLVIPAAARTMRVDRLRGPFRARLLLGHTFWRRLNVGAMSANAITNGAAFPSMGEIIGSLSGGRSSEVRLVHR
jgi:hypothetical protein